MLAVNLATSILAIVAVALRLISRRLVSKRWWVDDIIIGVTALLIVPFCVLGAWSELYIDCHPFVDENQLTSPSSSGPKWPWYAHMAAFGTHGEKNLPIL